MKPITPQQAVKYYILLMFIILVVLVALFTVGCGNVSVPELNVGVTYPSPVPPTVNVLVGMMTPSTPPEPAGYLTVWLVTSVKGDAAQTQFTEWNFGDGSPVQHEFIQPGVPHLYPPAGRWTVTATVHEVTGRTTTGSMQLTLP